MNIIDNSLKILLIDKCHKKRETYSRYLQQQSNNNYQIIEADSSQKAIALCYEQFPSVILLTYCRKEMEESELINQLKKLRQSDFLPIILLISQKDEEEAIASLKPVIADYLLTHQIKADNLQLAVKYAIKQDYLNSQLRQATTKHQQTQNSLQHQLLRQRLIVDMLERIRESLHLDEILNTTVAEVRQFLKTDRVLIFRFQPDGSGVIETESVDSQWTAILDTNIHDPCFDKPQDGVSYVQRYEQGRVMAVGNIYNAGLEPCHIDLLASFEVRANLVVPILQRKNLWGLLIAHHCQSPRQWQPEEIDLLQQLAIQLGIAIAQSNLYEKQQQASDLLEKRVKQRTAELAKANQDLRIMQEELRQQNQALIVAQQVAESERQRYQNLFSQAPDGYFVTDKAGNIQEANQAAIALLDVMPQQLVGQSLIDFITIPYSQTLQTKLTQSELVKDWEVYLKRNNQHTFPAILSITNICNSSQQPIELLWLIRDISDSKKAQQKIREQAALIDISTDAILVQDLEHRVLFWSQGAERLYGWDKEEILGKKIFDFFSYDSFSKLETRLNTAIKKGVWYGELEQITKDKRTITVESRWTVVLNETQQPESILIVNTDITNKKYLDIQFYRMQRLESIGTLASGIAHDLNNILQPILFTASLLKKQSAFYEQPIQKRLKIIEDYSQRGIDLTKQIVSFACGEEDQDRMIIQVESLLEEVVQVAQRTSPKSVEIELKLKSEKLWTVLGNKTQLHQVFMNLMVNACDAILEEGKVTIIAEILS
ncbi:PAS domain S-box protein [Cyanothece sp. BG0011]|uniref:PAS domain S-box protein n=1 Tax=Cyanothece sp. BG0011 TaxID=2082950 RepID=UPI000D1ED1C6|nr:PAS domain S-box protein [Cyanothece sp. BG0011]